MNEDVKDMLNISSLILDPQKKKKSKKENEPKKKSGINSSNYILFDSSCRRNFK